MLKNNVGTLSLFCLLDEYGMNIARVFLYMPFVRSVISTVCSLEPKRSNAPTAANSTRRRILTGSLCVPVDLLLGTTTTGHDTSSVENLNNDDPVIYDFLAPNSRVPPMVSFVFISVSVFRPDRFASPEGNGHLGVVSPQGNGLSTLWITMRVWPIMRPTCWGPVDEHQIVQNNDCGCG